MKAAINSLNGGEITPLMRGRGDLESLRRAAVQMRKLHASCVRWGWSSSFADARC